MYYDRLIIICILYQQHKQSLISVVQKEFVFKFLSNLHQGTLGDYFMLLLVELRPRYFLIDECRHKYCMLS